MENKGSDGPASGSGGSPGSQGTLSADQVAVLERLFAQCEKPSHARRLVMISEHPVLFNLSSDQIKDWFKNCRSLKKQGKKLASTKKKLLRENERLHKEVQLLVDENELIQVLLQNI